MAIIKEFIFQPRILNEMYTILATGILFLMVIVVVGKNIRTKYLIALALVSLTTFYTLFGFYKYPYRYDDKYYYDLRGVQLWASKYTPRGKLLLTPPSAGIWAGLSERGSWMDYNLVGYAIYAPWLMDIIATRLNIMGIDLTKTQNMGRLLDNMLAAYYADNGRALINSSANHGDYAIRELKYMRDSCDAVYRNHTFVLCKTR